MNCKITQKHDKHSGVLLHFMLSQCIFLSVCITKSLLMARFLGPTWGPSGADRTQVGPMLAPWTLLSGQLPLIMSGPHPALCHQRNLLLSDEMYICILVLHFRLGFTFLWLLLCNSSSLPSYFANPAHSSVQGKSCSDFRSRLMWLSMRWENTW